MLHVDLKACKIVAVFILLYFILFQTLVHVNKCCNFFYSSIYFISLHTKPMAILFHCHWRFRVNLAYRSDNFIIGVTNISVAVQPPVLGDYAICGQYPGSVPSGATVSLQCDDDNLPPARYVIVQFPITDYMNFCELSVCARGLFSAGQD